MSQPVLKNYVAELVEEPKDAISANHPHFLVIDHMHAGHGREVRVAFGIQGYGGESMYVSRKAVIQLYETLGRFLRDTQ